MNDTQRSQMTTQSSRLEGAGISDPGKVRTENQDAIFLDESGTFMLLADGMGGHERGGEASTTALTIIRKYLTPEAIRNELCDITEGSGVPGEIVCIQSLVDEAIREANSTLYERNQKERLQRFMGTTVVGLVFLESDYVVWFHVGDSRIYRWRDSALSMLTTDHSARNEWKRQGRQGAEPGKNVITRAIGPTVAVSADTLWDKPENGDIYLLCSDGLTDMITEQDIVEVIKKERRAEEIAARLVDAANAAGGKDNVSVVVCCV
jgi:PPM family protein phosphatase